MERQFAHQLAAPVRSIHLGTDHLDPTAPTEAPPEPGSAIAALEAGRFLLVLGNDFAHKNRDFAVKVFQDMQGRGYDGRLVLAGFHLDNGSSFDRELAGGGDGLDRVIRIGAVTEPEKTWLLGHAAVVLYPTSSEGFGFIPFEAAALGTPTAFVKFGPLQETLPGVRSCNGWQVRAFADHVFSLIADPSAQIAEIQAAGAALTWRKCADQMIDAYLGMLDDAAPGTPSGEGSRRRAWSIGRRGHHHLCPPRRAEGQAIVEDVVVMKPIQLFVPTFRIDECLEEIRECLEKGWTGLGYKTIAFEQAWQSHTGLPHAHFVNSATSGLHLAVRLLRSGMAGTRGDEIISTPMTFRLQQPRDSLRAIEAGVCGRR